MCGYVVGPGKGIWPLMNLLGVSEKESGGGLGILEGMSRFQMLSDAQWELIAPMFPARTGRQGRPASDARTMVEAIIYRYRCGIAWRDLPAVYGPWQTVWTWHRRMEADGTWSKVLRKLTADAESQGLVRGSVAVDSTVPRAHRQATNSRRLPEGWIELQEPA